MAGPDASLALNSQPAQKAATVRLVKVGMKAMVRASLVRDCLSELLRLFFLLVFVAQTLSIGDGANDVGLLASVDSDPSTV